MFWVGVLMVESLFHRYWKFDMDGKSWGNLSLVGGARKKITSLPCAPSPVQLEKVNKSYQLGDLFYVPKKKHNS